MRQIIVGLLLTISCSAFGQKLYSGIATFDNEKWNMISIHFNKEINPFIKRLEGDFGIGETYKNNGNSSPGLRWTNLNKKEWSDKKLLFRTYVVGFGGNLIMLISCVDENGLDLLTPKTETQKKIKKYIKNKIKE